MRVSFQYYRYDYEFIKEVYLESKIIDFARRNCKDLKGFESFIDLGYFL